MTLDRETILREAERLVAVHGLPRVSLRHLSEALRVTKAALYHHFPDGKTEILEGVLHREEALLARALDEAASQQTDPRLQVRAMAQADLSLLAVHPLRPAEGDPASARLLRRHLQRRRRIQREALLRVAHRGIEEGIFRSTDPPRLATFFQIILERMVEPLAAEVPPEEAGRRVALWLDFFFHGIVAEGARPLPSGH